MVVPFSQLTVILQKKITNSKDLLKQTGAQTTLQTANLALTIPARRRSSNSLGIEAECVSIGRYVRRRSGMRAPIPFVSPWRKETNR
jgi:hypothetical protein